MISLLHVISKYLVHVVCNCANVKNVGMTNCDSIVCFVGECYCETYSNKVTGNKKVSIFVKLLFHLFTHILASFACYIIDISFINLFTIQKNIKLSISFFGF